jgi:hypothetical protein
MNYGLQELAQSEGYEDINDLLEEAVYDSVSPGICPDCGYTTMVEPDQDEGWCEECNKGTVQSALMLAGLI